MHGIHFWRLLSSGSGFWAFMHRRKVSWMLPNVALKFCFESALLCSQLFWKRGKKWKCLAKTTKIRENETWKVSEQNMKALKVKWRDWRQKDNLMLVILTLKKIHEEFFDFDFGTSKVWWYQRFCYWECWPRLG